MIRILATQSLSTYAIEDGFIARRSCEPDLRFGASPLRLLTPLPDMSLVGTRALLHVEDIESDTDEGVVFTTSFVIQDFTLTDDELDTLMRAIEVVTDERTTWAIPQIVIT